MEYEGMFVKNDGTGPKPGPSASLGVTKRGPELLGPYHGLRNRTARVTNFPVTPAPPMKL